MGYGIHSKLSKKQQTKNIYMIIVLNLVNVDLWLPIFIFPRYDYNFHIQTLPNEQKTLDEIREWTDEYTWTLNSEITAYNPDLGMIGVIVVGFEFTPGEGWVFCWQFKQNK